ncbi:MAG: hypothetical protein M1816_005916 [Peltula sp. TS41687]|nr:MAG: hypothetical protein M1816_005916 [Peltula sp. TS41687]
MNTTWCEALPYETTPYEALYSRKPHRNPDVEEVKEMLGGIGEQEIIQGLDGGENEEEIEELLGLIDYEADPDLERKEQKGGDEDEDEEESTVLAADGPPGSTPPDASDSEVENEDRLLDNDIRAKNARNREKMIQKYGKQHTVVVF